MPYYSPTPGNSITARRKKAFINSSSGGTIFPPLHTLGTTREIPYNIHINSSDMAFPRSPFQHKKSTHPHCSEAESSISTDAAEKYKQQQTTTSRSEFSSRPHKLSLQSVHTIQSQNCSICTHTKSRQLPTASAPQHYHGTRPRPVTRGTNPVQTPWHRAPPDYHGSMPAQSPGEQCSSPLHGGQLERQWSDTA